MNKNKVVAIFLTVLFAAGTLAFAGGPQRRTLMDKSKPPKPYAEGEVLVKFKEGLSVNSVENFAASRSLKIKKQYSFMSKSLGQQIVLLKSASRPDAEALALELAADPSVESASPNYFRYLAVTHPNDTYYNTPYQYLWGLNNVGQNGGTNDADIDAPEAWDISTGSSSVIVAVIDTGLDYRHPDLAANCWKNPGEIAGNGVDDDGNGYVDDVYGIDPCGTVYANNVPDTDPMDGYGHGTHCAGSIGARGNNSRGVVGVNWNVRIMGLKFFDDIGDGGADADAIECIQYAVYQKVHGQNVAAISASWGGVPGSTQDSGILRNAIEFANNAGIVFCAAAGNGGSDGVGDNNDAAGGANHHYPSDYTLPGIIAVAATDRNDALGSFSNYGTTSVDLGAPGVSILSTVPGRYIPVASDIFFDDMESGSGKWTTGGTPNSWGISTDQETLSSVNFPVPSPTHFLSDSPGADYANSSNSWIMNNTNIDLSGYVGQTTYIGFAAAWGINTNDHGLVEISANGGTSWTTIHDQAYDGYVYYWSRYSGVIPEAFKTAQFRIRFRLTSNTTSVYDGFLIDDVGIGTGLTYSYESWDGTSMACPHVAGAVAYLASIFPSETVAQRKYRILSGGDDIASMHTTTYSGNRLNLYGAYTHTPPVQPSITVTSPNGGEVWTRGTTHAVTWTTTGTVGNVQIHYSLNSGTSWTQIVASTANTGTYSWAIGGGTTPSANCLVRVREASDSDPSDTSNAVFAIVASSAETVSTPTTPTGTAAGMVGTTYAYSTGGSTSSSGHSVQYRFDWGDGTYSSWLTVGTTSSSHAWGNPGTYNVRAMARCSTHFIQSGWSSSLPVTLDDTPTWAAVTRFVAGDVDGMPAAEWHTGGEAGAAGFNLWRRDRLSGQYERVNPELLPALAGAPQGGIYRFADPGAFPGEPTVYLLEETDAMGRTRTYGPFTVEFGAAAPSFEAQARIGRELPSEIYGYQRFERGQTLFEQRRLEARRQELGRASLQAASGKERARVTVRERGLFYVTAGQIAGSMGLSEATAASLIGRYGFKLTTLGKECAWLADANGAGLFFYNEGLETVFSDRNVFFLERGSGLAMNGIGGGSAGPVSGQTYQDSRHFEGNQYALLLPSMDPAGDLWFWDYVVAGAAAKPFAVDVPGAAPGRATLKVSLQGATDTEAESDHHAVVSLNGTEIGEGTWGGVTAHEIEVAFDAGLLRDGANELTVGGRLDTGAPYGTFYVESFDLSYPRYYQAAGNAIICRPDGHSVITVSGLTELQVAVLDVTMPRRPLLLTGVAPDVAGRVTFVPRSPDRVYLVSGLNAARRPLAVAGDRPSQLKGRARAAEYIVIAPEELAAAAQELAEYRRRKGLKTLVATLEDIYDAFSFGAADPNAIRDFLAYANKNWGKVKYAVLAGKGTYDYNDYSGKGDNLLPALLGRTPEGLCASDRIFGDIRGRDNLPEIAIGRLPAVTGGELATMIAKIKAYEDSQGAWTDKALFIADNTDSGGDFAASCNELAALATGYAAEKFYLAGSPAGIKEGILASWNAGAALATYCGHGGIDQLAAENLLDAGDAASLANGGQLPLAMLFTCAAGRFELPGFTSLGEALALNGSGGMAGGLVPSGAALNSDSLRLGGEFFKAAIRGKAQSAGTALLAAMKSYLLQGGKPSLLNVYNWIGDPALKFK